MSKPAAIKPVKPVILCGVSGTRLWPLSRKSFPKQFVPLINGKSLLQLTLERLALLGSEVTCVASDEHRFLVSECMQAANVKGTVLLEAIRILGLEKKTRFYQASTSELYGLVQETPQKETTPFYPRSPYAVAKLYAYWIVVNYREAYGMYACNGILFNHESPRRGETFVTRKITRGLANISQGLEDCLHMGNIDALRDWGHAKDYVRMQWLMLQQDKPEDFVIATGLQYSVRQFIEWTADELGMPIRWEGSGVNEVGYCGKQAIVRIDPRYFRPTEVETLLGDPGKAKQKLGWTPEICVQELCREMVKADLEEAKQHSLLKKHGYKVCVSIE